MKEVKMKVLLDVSYLTKKGRIISSKELEEKHLIIEGFNVNSCERLTYVIKRREDIKDA
jgi:hypothetical protein